MWTFTEARPKGDVDEHWTGCVCSETGQHMIAYSRYESYYSDDYGVTWSAAAAVGQGYSWMQVMASAPPFMSADGSRVLILEWLGTNPNRVIRRSTDYGATYPTNIVSTYQIVSLAADGDCNHISSGNAARDQWTLGYPYVSTNGGTSFTSPWGGGHQWYGQAWSKNGTYGLFGCRYDTFGWTDYGHIYKTINGGVSWTEIFPVADTSTSSWNDGFISDDGQIIRCNSYLSTNGGSSWTNTGTSAPYRTNADCSKALRLSSYRLYFSEDYGVTQEEVRPKGDVNVYWCEPALSHNGEYMMVGDFNNATAGGRLYIGTFTPGGPSDALQMAGD